MPPFGPGHMSPCQQTFLVRYAGGFNRVEGCGPFSQEGKKLSWKWEKWQGQGL